MNYNMRSASVGSRVSQVSYLVILPLTRVKDVGPRAQIFMVGKVDVHLALEARVAVTLWRVVFFASSSTACIDTGLGVQEVIIFLIISICNKSSLRSQVLPIVIIV